MIDYTPLWETMKQKNLADYDLIKGGIDNKTLSSLKKNESIPLSTLEKLCLVCGCTPNEVVQFI